MAVNSTLERTSRLTHARSGAHLPSGAPLPGGPHLPSGAPLPGGPHLPSGALLPGGPHPHAALSLLAAARHGLHEAATTSRPAERYANAHLAALRCAAAVLAARARPELPGSRRVRRSRNAWVLLTEVAPELAEWAAFFAAGAAKRAAAEAGLEGAVTAREADDLLRDTEIFLALVETTIGVVHQPALPVEAAWS